MATATGAAARAIGTSATATGYESTAFGATAVAMGAQASALGQSAVAVGARSQATADTATAVGYGASATYGNSAAFGNGATVTRKNQQVFGTASNTYTTPGITSEASLAAQGPVQGLVTTDASGNLAPDGGALQGQVNTNTSNIAKNASDIDTNTEGVAMSMPMASAIPELYSGETFAISGSWGTFEGENGLAFGGRMRLTDRFSLAGGVSAGLDNGSVGGTVSGRIGW